MSKKFGIRVERVLALLFAFFVFAIGFAQETRAQVNVNFESPTYTAGNINGQDGWLKTGPFDVAVSSSFGTAGFGSQSLRISNAVTSGSFGDQTFSKPLYNEAGEAGATNGGMSGGVRMSHFEAQYSIASKVPGAQQPGLFFSNSADRGDGARMTYLRYEDQSDGIHVFFDDYIDASPFGGANGDPAGCGMEDDFTDMDIAILDRTVPHVIKIVVDFVAGPRNDVVKVYIDGILVKTGTSWEDYFRYCSEQAADNNTHTVDSLLFRTAGTAAPANAGNGFLIDNLTLLSGPTPNVVNVGAGSLTNTPNYTQWFWWNDENDTIDNSLGSFVTGPGTPPIGVGSAQSSVTGTQRRNLATYQFAATPLSAIGTLKFSTYNPSAGNGGSANRSGYLNFNVDFTGSSSSFQRRLAYIPSQNGTVMQNTWQEWDAINGGNAQWFYSGPTWPAGIGGGGEPGTTTKTWNQILSQYPNIRVNPVDSWMGIRVGEPYADGYTENIDKFMFGTSTNLTVFNFDPMPAVVYVDDSWAGTPLGGDPDAGGPATSFGYDAFATVQGGVSGVSSGGTVNVATGTYNEDVTIPQPLVLNGAGPAGVSVVGAIGGPSSSTVAIQASNVEIKGLTITRAGNNGAQWNDPNLNSAGISIQGLALTGSNIHDNFITGMRTAIDVNNSNGHNIHNNVIDFNHTGLIFRNQTDNITFTENQVTNNRTLGVLFLDASGGTNVPVQSALNCTFSNNNISGNWYGEIVDRQTGGALPAPGTTNLKNFSSNWYGSTTPVITTAGSAEPGYGSMCPVEYGMGCSATNPGGQPDIAGAASANFDFTPLLAVGTDASPGTYGFQGDYGTLIVRPDGAQVGALSRILEAVTLVNPNGHLTIGSGTYTGNANVNKPLNIQGSFTITGSLSLSVPGAQISPGNSPGIINTGDFSMVAGTTYNCEINGPNVGSQYDQINVTGTVSLGGATLHPTLGYTPTTGQVYTIINNDGTDAVTGTFAGLPEGTVFYLGPNSLRISYVGGTGNDVTLTSVALCNAVSIPTNIQSLTGAAVNVPINVDDTTNKGLMSTDFTITYNPAVVTTPVVTLGTVTAGSVLTVNATTPGTLIVSIFNTSAFTGAGTLANISYTVNGLPGTSTPITFSAFKFNEGTQCLTTSNGLVTVIGGTITGTVTYGNSRLPGPPSRPVSNVTIAATGPTTFSTLTSSTGCPSAPCGTYSLSGFLAGTYTRTASKTGGQNGAVTSFDSAKIARHVTGLEPFDNEPAQSTVADVSGNGQVTSFDASLIARYAVSLPGSGTSGNWIFTPATYGPSTVYTNIAGEDYTALLMGDVTGNWGDPASYMNPSRPYNPNTARGLTIWAGRASASAGSDVLVPITIRGAAQKGIVSYQFEMRYDPAVIRPAAVPVVVEETLSSGYVATANADELGVLRVSVFGAQEFTRDGTLLNLRFTAVGKPGRSSTIIWDTLLMNEGDPRPAVVDGSIAITAANDAQVTGRVLTSTGQPVDGALVRLADTEGRVLTVLSDATGTFVFGDVRNGQTYTISVESDKYTFAALSVSAVGRSTSVDVIAEP